MAPLSLPEVNGVLGESVEFQWKVNRGNESFKVAALSIFNGTNDESQQIFGLLGNVLLETKPVTVDRVNASILGDIQNKVQVTCKLTLEKIQFYDKSRSFYLLALFTGPGQPKQSGAVITLATVFGMHFSFSF